MKMLRFERRVRVVTLAPVSLQMRAAARSRGVPQLRSALDLGHAARWSPRGSKDRRHRLKLIVYGTVVKTLLAKGPIGTRALPGLRGRGWFKVQFVNGGGPGSWQFVAIRGGVVGGL